MAAQSVKRTDDEAHVTIDMLSVLFLCDVGWVSMFLRVWDIYRPIAESSITSVACAVAAKFVARTDDWGAFDNRYVDCSSYSYSS
jgi:hypothetical protein